MSRYGTIIDNTDAKTTYVESSDPDDLRQKLNLVFNNIAAMDTPQLIADITLAGAGDGFSFVVVVDYAPLTAMDGGLLPQALFAITYMASTQSELAAKRSQIPTLNEGLIDDQLAGASQGTRFMGLLIGGEQASINANTAFGAMGFDNTVATLSIGSTGLLVPILASAMVLQPAANRFDRPSAGVLRYIGPLPITVQIDAVVSCAIPAAVATAHAMRVAIVGDPAGTPTQIGLSTRFGCPFGASSTADAVCASTFAGSVILGQNDAIGIAMVDDTGALTGNNALEIVSAQIRAIEM